MFQKLDEYQNKSSLIEAKLESLLSFANKSEEKFFDLNKRYET